MVNGESVKRVGVLRTHPTRERTNVPRFFLLLQQVETLVTVLDGALPGALLGTDHDHDGSGESNRTAHDGSAVSRQTPHLFDPSYALDDASLDLLLPLVTSEVKLIVELGSGLSTVLLAAVLPRDASLLTLEESWTYWAATRDVLQQEKSLAWREQRVFVHRAPLVGEHQFYELPDYLLGSQTHFARTKIDLLVVDGPRNVRGYQRLPAFAALKHKVADDGLIFVDDAKRDAPMIEAWLDLDDAWEAEHHDTPRGACVMRRKRLQ